MLKISVTDPPEGAVIVVFIRAPDAFVIHRPPTRLKFGDRYTVESPAPTQTWTVAVAPESVSVNFTSWLVVGALYVAVPAVFVVAALAVTVPADAVKLTAESQVVPDPVNEMVFPIDLARTA